MTTRVRTLNFLPEIFQTKTNTEFLSATLDQLVNPPVTKQIQGYVGSKVGYGVNSNDYYVTEPTKTRTDYQLDPGVVFTKTNQSTAQDFISYPGILDALELQGAIVDNNSRLFESQIYSWDSFTDLDKIVNYHQYYWVPGGLPPVTVSSAVVYTTNDYIVTDSANGYSIKEVGTDAGSINPTLTLLRGGTYTFQVDQSSQFWIQGAPGVSGYSLTQPNVPVRDVYGVTNNGATNGTVTFNVPSKDAQDEYLFPGNNVIDVVSTTPLAQVDGALLSTIGSIDGITSLNGLRVMFYNTGIPSDGDYYYTIAYIGDPLAPTLQLTSDGSIPVEQNITPLYGTTWINRKFYKNTSNVISLVPYISAPLDQLYYQDGTSANNVGIIRLIESNTTNTINVETDILGKQNYTSTNGVVFTNGLKVEFDGAVIPSSYLSGQYYVQGVGSAIELLSVESLVSPEGFTVGVYIPFDSAPYDTTNFDSDLFVPIDPDYITIARNALNKNAWSRSNSWFHSEVINQTALYNNTPSLVTVAARSANKARRPIIEFYPNLKLLNSGTVGKEAVDFIDQRSTDALSQVAGLYNYYPDVEVFTANTADIAVVSTSPVAATAFIVGSSYQISTLGNTDWNIVAGTTGITYALNDTIQCAVVGTGTGYGILVSTTITIPTTDITGTFQIGQYITDYMNVLPRNTQITDISIASPNTVLTVAWADSQSVASTPDVAVIATDTTVDSYALFSGARIIFADDQDINVRNKIYVASFSQLVPFATPVITLTEALDGTCEENNQTVILRGYNNQGNSFYFNGDDWVEAQEKITVNQAPLFDVFDKNGISFSDPTVYIGSTFAGCKLFAYGLGSGIDDAVLGFPIRYSAINNVGDISFDVSLNTDTFDYVTGTTPITQKVNTGYVFNFDDRTVRTRKLGWQTAIAPSQQYQVFQFTYLVDTPSTTFVCDIAATPEVEGVASWASVQVFVNNVCQCVSEFSYTTTDNTTTIELLNTSELLIDTPIEVLILSNQISAEAYYSIPVNLNNNPFNQTLEVVNVGDIRLQYRDIYVNAPGILGQVFGSNNYRDLGNLVPYGTKIIQNSASLVLPGTFLRKAEHNLFDALMFNSREYIKFKNLLVDTINSIEYTQRYTPSEVLDQALDIITASKSESQAFFWSDMLPAKSVFRTNTYTFANNLDTSIYPLTTVYNFESANYNGVIVYLTRIVDNLTIQKQLIINQDYTVSKDAPSLTVTLDLLAGDKITINEYNQTYGSYVPNTPTKLGLYPASIPGVVLDNGYTQPTYFIKGHDGSYNKLYGSYTLGVLDDFRDQGLLEFELRIYNNLKLSSTVPVQAYEVLPGFFRDTDHTYSEFLTMYSGNFLNWVGQNRLNYKTQYFNKLNEYTYNYTSSANKLDNAPIEQGYWRGVYQYFYDTTTPNATPWEMLGLIDQPTWWTSRYGPAPYTSDNLILWSDLEEGLIWNDGNPIIVEAVARPGLLDVIPVDSAGNLVSPFTSVVGNYNPNTFQKDWKVGDNAPVELSYRRSSSYPFDLMKLFALMKPANFFNLGVDLDNYKYNTEFNQYLVNDRSHLVISDVEIYGSGTAKTSYINWIVDYEKQIGVSATQNITELLDNLDVRLVYRLAGYSDKDFLKFYVEKGTPNSRNASLLIPDESYSLLLYDNQPFSRIVYSGVVVQITRDGYTVFGNSQNTAYFKILKPINNGRYDNIEVENSKVKVAADYSSTEVLIPYGNTFYSEQELSQFLASYGAYLSSQGMIFSDILNGIEITWNQMVSEFLYWTQTGWEVGSIIMLNPSAQILKIDKESSIVQPLTVQQTNFVLNQNLYPIQAKDMSVFRDGTAFSVTALNQGDTIAYGQFNISNFEHGIVFDNVTLFNDVIYDLITGLRQNRVYLRGTKTAEWNGTVTASGFILNQDNIQEWSRVLKYTKGSIVLYKNKYWTALKVLQASEKFNEQDWKETDYDQIQKGLLPNSSTRSYESTLYYDINKANLEKDGDLLGFSLIGFRPRDYLALVDLTDITQVNVYQNIIKNKGTRNAVEAFKGTNLPQGGIEYEVYENWAIKSSEYGGLLNKNFVDFRINETYLTGNPAIVSLTTGIPTEGSQQEIPTYSLFNYSRPIDSPNILSILDSTTLSGAYPNAGYVNFNDVKTSSYFYSGLPLARDINNELVPINNFYVGDYTWLANYLESWDVLSWESVGRVIAVRSNLNNTATITFAAPHGLSRLQPLSIINYATNVDGYYVVANVVGLNEVIINLAVVNEIVSTGQGIGLTFKSQRVSKPSDINDLPLLNNEFVKNTVWVDESTDGSWAVYRKNLNYLYDDEVTKPNSTTFGSAVAYTDQAGYLISDASLGEVYRYTKTSSGAYSIIETLTGGTSFGSQIAYSGSTYIISKPTSTPIVRVYVINDSQLTEDFLLCQTISAPVGVTNWGSEVSISGDGNWLYISDIANNKVHTYRKQNILLNAGYFTASQTYIINDLGTTDFTLIGAIENKVGITFVATGVGTGTGTATQISYQASTIIDGNIAPINATVTAGSFIVGITYTITTVGTTNWNTVAGTTGVTYIVGDTLRAETVGSGTGTANETINFGKSITTSYYGDTLVVGAPDKDYSGTIANWGSAYAFSRAVQNIEVQNNTIGNFAQSLPLAWTPSTHTSRAGFSVTSNVITANGSMTGFSDDDPIVFSDQPVIYTAGSFNIGTTYTIVSIGTTDFTLIGAASNTVGISFTASGVGTGTGTASSVNFGGTGIQPNVVYYIQSRSGSTFTIKETRSSNTPITLINGSNLSFGIYVQTSPLYVYRNGVLVQDNNYGVIGSNLVYSGTLTAGDIITVSDSKFTYTQTFTSDYTRIGTQFGYSLDTTRYGAEVLVGSPFEINDDNQEGAVYRFTNAGAKFGLVTGVNECAVTTTRSLLINGYLVNIPAGNATVAANAINSTPITNIQAAASADNKLVIQVINSVLTQVNRELILTVVDTDTLNELGIDVYTNTQIITCPHVFGPTQFGSVVKFNEYGSVVISAPVGTRYSGTTFDFVDDENYTNDTIFDNNATQFVDTAPNAGAVYMFDYIENYNENLSNIGDFVYAQNVNSKDIEYGFNPLYGTALDFNSNVVMIGTPNFLPESVDGQVTIYENETGIRDWSIYRSSSAIVDINSIQNAQLFSAETNNTLINLDYIDPLQGKLLGSVRQNIDYVSSIDPANYNSLAMVDAQSGLLWGVSKVGKVWFDTTNVRFVNYHQNDNVYNSKYWGTVFPGSDVAVYTWLASNVAPSDYQGPGVPKDATQYTVSSVLDASNVVVPVYYFWVRNSNVIFREEGKTLSDAIIESYISNPRNSGISFFTPLLQNTFALYNCGEYINANDSVFHIGYANGTNDDEAHAEYTLIRENFADDFLPGLPKSGSTAVPEGLYDRLLDSLSGVDEAGNVVPNPYLPRAVQSGILARPRQSFFYDRLLALKNYLTYANEVLAQYPISEIRPDVSFLFAENSLIYTDDGTTLIFEQGEKYNTANYWQYINWWAVGYDNNTRSVIQVPLYADLSTLSVTTNTIVTVENNGSGKFEVYRYDGSGVWTRIGLENGTIEFSSYLWDYAAARLGFGDNFFDTNSYDEYPSEETRNIIRALNEQIYVSELLIFRNKSLILLFDYIQSESSETQNYLPWLNKTSLVDVSHVIRELKPIEVFQTDNQEFLAGYINEVKPYHVVIKEFLFKYTGTDVYDGNFTDFDLPAQYNASAQQFITPSLVYSNPNSGNEYLNTDDIWQTAPYTQWFQNKGVSLTGQYNYPITTLVSYMAIGSSFMFVDNAQGFPINGVVTIGTEQIGYSSVDRALNLISGLSRGYNGTDIAVHFPNETIFIDLPEVLVLNGGTGYVNPPRVTAYIDSVYPAPTTEAVLEAVMSLDSVLSVNVINPGQGYMVLPEIRIEPSLVISFTNSDINTLQHTVVLYAPSLVLGDVVQVQYKNVDSGLGVGKLVDNQWYYINILQTIPAAVIAFYNNYSDAINDTNRIEIEDIGVDDALSISFGARASAITAASPVRENNITLRFDRTTYNSQVQDWREGSYYGSFFAGSYFNSENVSSSSIQLESVLPPISSILASAQGVAFEIAEVANDRQLTWSSLERNVGETISTNNVIRIIPLVAGSVDHNASGSTVGFYVGMPVKFVGVVVGGLQENTTYYVKTVINDTDFNVSLTVDGAVETLTTASVSVAGLKCLVGEVVDTAVLTVNYPGILEVTATQAGTNAITVPISLIGTGGTDGFYTNIPVFFTDFTPGPNIAASSLSAGELYTIESVGTTDFIALGASANIPGITFVATGPGPGTGTAFLATFGGILENEVYYVTTVIDNEKFTISETQNPLSTTVYSCSGSTDIIVVDDTEGFVVNDPIIFTNMIVSGSSVTTFGSIVAGTTYYISNVINATQIKISTLENGSVFDPGTVAAASNTSALVTSQANTLTLSTATGSMTINVSLPVSPGQINGQLFTLYGTSGQYADVSGTNGNLIERTLAATITTVNRIAIKPVSGNTNNFYVNMPLQFDTTVGGLTSATTYYVKEFGTIEIDVTDTSSIGDAITCDTTESLYVDMPIVFTGQGLGGIVIGVTYYIESVIDSTQFTIADTLGGVVKTLTTDSGPMTGTGDFYIKVSASSGGSVVALTTAVSEFIMTQKIITNAEFDVSYVLGGYRALVSVSGLGYAIDNTITILGVDIGGATPTNNLTLTVNTIDTNGGITDVICSGIVAGTSEQYYLKVISPNQFEVYSNPLMTVPVSGIGFAFVGFTTTTATAVTASTDSVTITAITLSSVEITGTAGQFLCTAASQPLVVGQQIIISGTLGGTGTITGYTNPTTYYIIATNGSTTFTLSTSSGGSAVTTTAGTPTGLTYTVSDFLVNDPVVFTGTMFSSDIVLGQTYYIYDKTSTTVRLTTNPGSVAGIVNITSNTTGSMLMTKAGSFALLPEPFYFNQSIVKFNNRLYVCVVSNNDDSFVFGKWELLDSGDRRLNAMDRVIGYYQPTVNMPGVDLTQLFEGVTYPNSTYLGNSFAPAQQFDLDTILETQPFYPTEVDISGVVWNGQRYLSAANLPNYSAVLDSVTGEEWDVAKKLTNVGIGVTDLIYANSIYVMTSTNSATPIIRSSNGTIWTSTGTNEQSPQPINIAALSLHSVAYGDDLYVAVGEGIVTSSNTYMWTERLTFGTTYANTLYGVSYADVAAFTGFVAVGKGEMPEYSTGLTETVDTDLIYYSTNGNTWTGVQTLSSNGLYGVAASDTTIIAVGEEGVIYYSENGANWLGVNEVTIVSVNSATDVLNVTNTAGFAVNDLVRFTDSFCSIITLVTSGSFVIGQPYIIVSLGTTNFTLIGATQVTAGAFDINVTYIINSIGTTDWNAVADTTAVTYNVGDTIVARIAGSGTGTALKTTFTATGVGTGTGTANSVNAITTIVNSGSFVIGRTYIIVTLGTTDFTLIGAASNTVGVSFIATGVGTGTGTANSGYYITNVVSSTQVQISNSSGGAVLNLTDTNIPFRTRMYSYPTTDTLRDVVYGNGVFIAVGDNGVIRTSNDVITWTTEVSGTTEDLNGISYKEDGTFIAVGNNNTVLLSDDFGATWTSQSVLLVTPPIYDILGDEFASGYAPEELVAGVVTDNLALRVNTRPGTNWPATIYSHTGYQVVSLELEPESGTQTTYSFRNATQYPFDIFVAVIDGTTGLSTTVYENDGYTIDWANNTIILDTPLPFTPVMDTLRIDAYSVGNGNQLVKSDSLTTPVRLNADSGFSEIFVGCDYYAPLYTGDGVINTGTGDVWTDPAVYRNGTKQILGLSNAAIRTKASNNAVVVSSTTGFVADQPITFDQQIFAASNIVPFTTYYIKTIINSTEFTISETSGGTVKVLGNATGLSLYVTNDYAIGITDDNVSAKLIFANDYDSSTDYIAYAIFGESEPVQYGYTLPETQLIVADGTVGPFALDNFVGGDNPSNAIVEVDGLRIIPTDYTINSSLDTITFNSVPAESAAVYVQSFSVSTQEATPTGIFFSPDGINMYIVGSTGDEVNQYLLSTAWNISTASFVRLFSVSAQDTSPQGLFFKPDGTKMYIAGDTGNDINEYALSTAWNISTASFIQVFSVAAQDATPTGVSFKNDGTKMYVIGLISDSVHEYTLGTAWNISTAVYLQSFSVAAQSITPTDISFTNDGTQMYIIGSDDDRVYKYTLGTAWDISTAVYLQSFSVAAQDSSPQGLFVKSDSTEMYIVGDTGNAVYEYTFTYPDIAVTTFNDTQQQYLNTQVITASSDQTVLAIQSISNEISLPLATTRATASTAGGTNQITVDSTTGFVVGATVQFKGTSFGGLSTTGTVYFVRVIVSSTVFTIQDEWGNIIVTTLGTGNMQVTVGGQPAVRVSTGYPYFSVAAQESAPVGIFFKPDGTQMYIVGSSGDAVYQYLLSIPWVISTADYVQSFSVSSQESAPTGIFFSSDGTRMYVVGATGDDVNQYALSTAWDISTASFIRIFSVAAQDTSPSGLSFKPDGTKMYVVGNTGNDINEYTLSTAWNISTSVFVQTFSVAAQDSEPRGVSFKPDGTKMYVPGSVNNSIYEYTLGTAWNISTASYLQTFSAAAQDIVIQDMYFKETGYGMYIVGSDSDSVYEYTLSTAWDISTAYIGNGLSENDIVRIDDTVGSVQLNNNTYYAKIIDSATFDLYETAYDPALGAINDPVTTISSYVAGGYVWIDGAYYIVDQVATNTTTSTNRITVPSTSQLVVDTPVIFTGTVFGNIVAGTTYYILEVFDATRFTIATTRGGSEFTLSTASGTMNVTQWEQVNIDRLWVTVNGERLPSSSLVLNADNNLSILTQVDAGDEVIITSMMPYATPAGETYVNFVDQLGEASVYRVIASTTTWLTEPLETLDTVIYVGDVTKLTDLLTQIETTPSAVSGYYNFGLSADKRSITDVTVYNNTTAEYIDSTNYEVVIVNLSPILKVTAGSYINVGDQVVITVLVGNLLYVNGEQIRFGTVDLVNNTLGNIERGVNGTGKQTLIPKYTEVFGLLPANKLNNAYYNQTWNPIDEAIFNTVEGDPLQISQTTAAEFLNVDNI